ncbi:MAG TPA: MBL fold metallo-hydrolase [Solirubrobacterales bacterium]|nr:MBL fold metallo-hydrolase [Solirubrobacterales bacterium]
MDPAPQNPAPGPSGHGRSDAGADGELDPELAWERIGDADIRMLRIPTPFAVGRVNTYLIEDDPLTLIDSGPNSGKALDELERQLGAVGRRIEEIELIVVTHQHIDHMGLVDIVAKRSGAEVAAIEMLAPFLAEYSREAELDDEFAAGLMLLHGIPEDMVIALRAVSHSFRAWGSRADVTRTLRDGDTLELAGRKLEVQLRPGHSPTDTLFWDEERRLLLGGDHLLGRISSNPLLARPLDGTEQRPRALLTYLESLRRTRELPAEIVLPGHGDPVTGHAALIDSRVAMHERRAAKLLELIRSEPLSAYQLAHSLWGNVAVTQAFLTLSEVVGHMDLLVERGEAREVRDGDIVRYSAA